MAIRLLLKNNNTDPVDINVYRDVAEINRDSLPAPLLTLSQVTGDSIVVTDPTAVQDNFYHYVFEVVGAKDRQLSRDFYLQATETRGEGKSKILIGDANLGYMDAIVADNLIGSADLFTALGMTTGSQSGFTYWYKFIRNNKILYIPNMSLIYTGMSVAAIRALGTLDGSKVLTLKGNKYKVRLPKGWNEDGSNLPVNTTSGDFENLTTQTNEFNDLMYTMLDYTPLGQRLPTLVPQPYTTLRLNSTSAIMCAETSSDGNYTLSRGGSVASRLALSTFKMRTVTEAVQVWPVLELIEE